MKIARLVVVLGGLALGLTVASYVGIRARTGEFLGPQPPDLGERHIRLMATGIPNLRGKPRGWVVTYSGGRFSGGAPVKLYFSPTGALLGTEPANLRGRLDRLRERDP